MTDVLKDKRYFWQADFSAQKVVVVVFEFRVAIVVPPAIDMRRVHTKKNNKKRSNTYVLASPYRSAGDLINCFPSLHRLHLKVSWVSHKVSSLNEKSCRSISTEKCRSASSFSSTTADERACFEA